MNSEMIVGFLQALGSSFVGTWCFGLLLHAPRKSWTPSAVVGAVGFALYWLLMQLGMSEGWSIFAASLVASMLAQVCARCMRMIATIFVTLSIVPLVPGLGLYRCMALLGQGQNAAGLQAGIAAMISFMMIALGLAVGGFLFRAVVSHAPRANQHKEGA